MKYVIIILLLIILLITGCLKTSPYKEVATSELLSGQDFEDKKICINGVFENNSISGIPIVMTQNFTGDIRAWTLVKACGTFRSHKLEADLADPRLSINTGQDIYHSNETLKVHADFISSDEGDGYVRISGIRNFFGKAFVDEKRNVRFKKGVNSFDFEFITPSCEECSALSPGEYLLNATASIDGRTFETYKKIGLEREDTNISENAENLRINYTLVPEVRNKTVIQTSNIVVVEYFYDPACQKCAKASPVIEELMISYGNKVNFLKYNILEDEGLALARTYELPGVPSIVIDHQKLIAYKDYDGDTERLQAILKDAIDNVSESSSAANTTSAKRLVLSVPYVLAVGFLAGFNPCLLAILAFIASVTLATTGKRRNMLLIVTMFSLGIFTTYLIVGIGLLRIFEESAGIQAIIKYFLMALIGILGVWHIFDAYHLRKNTESTFYTPKAFIRLTESVTKKVSLPASFFMGALFSLIKAPCVGAVYFVILDMVRSGKSTGIIYLAAYNLGVVLPVLVLGVAIAFGLNPEKVETFRKEKRSVLRLITGITLLVIAVLMYAGVI